MERRAITLDPAAFLSRQNVRVFVVDDEVIIAQTLSVILEKHGFLVRCFTSPLDALIAASHNPPDLLVSDVVMAEFNGVDLAIAIKESAAHCKFLLLSGQANTVDLLWSARARGYDFPLEAKPMYPTDLISRIEALLHP